MSEGVPPLPRFLEKQLPFARRLVDLGDARIHCVDDGDPAGLPVLFFHGNPTWSFLWRKVLSRLKIDRPALRLIAADLLGLGLSSKPLRARSHVLVRHVDVMARFTEAIGIDRAVVVAQDWGGPIGVGAAMEREERGAARFLRGLVLGNTAILEPKRPLRSTAFHRFSHVPIASDLAFRGALFPVPVLDRAQGEPASIGLREKAAYAWPLRRPWDRAAPLGLARMVPDREDHPSVPFLDRLGRWVRAFRGPAAIVWGEKDPILGRALARHLEALPQASVVRTQAGHFLQEEVPDELARAVCSVTDAIL